MHKIYLDDVRSPKDSSWTVVRNYQEFVDKISEIGDLSLIDVISLDHDLGDTAMKEYFTNVSPNYTLDYNNIKEKTGLDCAKWLIDYCNKNNLPFPKFYVHSMNPIGKQNIISAVNSFKKYLQK